ncbi:MAG TPA: sulfatase [Gemmataceae bacterium]|nr:sulfatase [Gemmataceae bacterium]
MIRKALCLFFGLAIPFSVALPALAGDEKPARPNIVFILADDLGINDLGCYGRKDQQSPHIDKLATQGMRFTCAYAQPVCSPSRAAILTGKDPARLHITTFLPGRGDAPSQKLLHPKIAMQLPLEEKTLNQRLKEIGYVSACIGKWHLGGNGFGPKEHGFDFVHAGQANTKPSDSEGGKGEYDLTKEALKFLEQNKDKHFFLYLAHNNPHVPLAAKPELVAKYKDSFSPVYAAMIETLDDSVGQVLAKLDELKLADNTIVVFTSDNGGLHVLEGPNTPATYNTPYRAGKGFLYEGGLRVPLIVRWPGKVTAGKVEDTPVIGCDWVPTFLDVCGHGIPDGLDGVSLAELFQGVKLWDRRLYWQFPHYTNQGGRPGGAIREGDFKLIEHYEDDRMELFDLKYDPGETRDRSNEYGDIVTILKARLHAWRRQIGAQENTANPNFDPAWHKKLYEDIDVSNLKPERTAAEMRPKLQAWRDGMNAVLKKK